MIGQDKVQQQQKEKKKDKKQPNYMIPHFSGGGKQKSADKYSDLSGTGVVTDPKKKKEQEDYMLHWVNKERVEFLGLPPLDKLTYASTPESLIMYKTSNALIP